MTVFVEIKREANASQETVDLFQQVKFDCWGKPVRDVGSIAVSMLMSSLVLMSDHREHALEMADATFALMRRIIADDYEQLLDDVSKEPARN